MTHYVALLRGISPLNPNMRNDKLRSVFEKLGFENVGTVVSSGNVVFCTTRTSIAALEKEIEAALPAQLGFTSTVIIRSRTQLQKLMESDPFKGYEHTKRTNLLITFLKDSPSVPLNAPITTDDGYAIIGVHGREICSVVDLEKSTSPKIMTFLEKKFGKQITSRTPQTVERILKKI